MLSSAWKSRLAKRRFLVADSQEMVSLIVSYLQDMGAATVFRATDGRAAIELLNNPGHRIDAVIYDMDLPRMGGLESLKFVRRRFGSMPFLMLSSNVTRESIAAAAKQQVDGYLAKPFTVQQLERRVTAMIPIVPALENGSADKTAENEADVDDAWSI